MKKVFITTITFNNPTAIVDCLESLEKVKKNNFSLSVVIVDNGSKERFKIDDKFKNFDLTLLRSEENLGFSGGQNLGIRHALKSGADYVVVLNDDVIVDVNLINNLLDAFKDGVGIVSPKIYFAKGYEFHKERYKKEDIGKVIWYAGGKVDWNNVFGQHIGVDDVDSGQFNKEN